MVYPRIYVLPALLLLALSYVTPADSQTLRRSAQTVAPVYEGFQRQPDGTIDLIFGYFNRNWEEEIHVPIGPDNHFTPQGPDVGQPTYFYPRRSRFVFRVKVPGDFGNSEVIWTLRTRGETLRAYGTLRPEYELDDVAIMANFGGAGPSGFHPSIVGNKRPTLTVVGDRTRSAAVGTPISLVATATDDGKPSPRSMGALSGVSGNLGEVRVRGGGNVAPSSATGLRLSWLIYRGPKNVSWNPAQIKTWEDLRDGGQSPWSNGFKTPDPPPGNEWRTEITFQTPGTYVLRCLAHDGGLQRYEDVTFVVSPPVQ